MISCFRDFIQLRLILLRDRCNGCISTMKIRWVGHSTVKTKGWLTKRNALRNRWLTLNGFVIKTTSSRLEKNWFEKRNVTSLKRWCWSKRSKMKRIMRGWNGTPSGKWRRKFKRAKKKIKRLERGRRRDLLRFKKVRKHNKSLKSGFLLLCLGRSRRFWMISCNKRSRSSRSKKRRSKNNTTRSSPASPTKNGNKKRMKKHATKERCAQWKNVRLNSKKSRLKLNDAN